MSSDARLVIDAQGLGKRYHLARSRRPETLAHRLAHVARDLLRPGAEPAEFWALRDVGFGIAQGETVGIIGNNGAGKSTLLKILARVTEPSRGRLRLRGRVASLLEVGTGFHPDLSARQNVYLNGAILGMRRKEITARFGEIVELAGITQFLDEPVKHLSSGMYMRLAFSVAVFLESEIMIVDEVLAVGDRAFQDKCLASMRAAAQAGRTVLFVSHDLVTVAQLAKRTLVFEGGSLAFDGATDAAIQHYLGARQQRVRGRLPTSEIVCTRRLRTGDSVLIREMGFAQSQPAEVVPGGDLRLELVVAAKARFEDLRILYSVNDLSGRAVLTGITPAFTADAGDRLLEITLGNLMLAPGEYDLTISVGRGGLLEPKTEYDAYGGFGRFVVGMRTSTGHPFGTWHPACGSVYHTSSTLKSLPNAASSG